MQHHHHHRRRLHPVTAPTAITVDDLPQIKRGKKRGNYNCSRCGMPKKGHSCQISTTTTTTSSSSSAVVVATPLPDESSIIVTTPSSNLLRNPPTHLRRALSFDDDDDDDDEILPESDDEDDLFDRPESPSDSGRGGFPLICLWDVLKRLPPPALLSAAKVCKGWRDCSKRIWRAAEELKLRVPARSPVWFVGSVLQKCTGLIRLSLTIESDIDSTMLACLAFSCPNLQAMEIHTSEKAVNRITGDELGRFVAEKRCLSSLKIEGCSNLGSFTLSSSSLSTLWLSDLCSLSKMVFNCRNLKELSLDFAREENDSTDLTTMVDSLGRTCPELQNLHIASVKLSHTVVLALTAANMRCLRMLSLVLGSEITDASVAAIASTYTDLELLDLSGSSISDGGIGMICNELSETLTRLLLALCPNITSSGIQFAAAQLPLLELMDCGMTICTPNSEDASEENSDGEQQKLLDNKPHLMYQKLIIKHARLKKLSLWGCSGLDALYLSCPALCDLNLTSCTNLHPERLLLQCPSLESVHASGCKQASVGTIQRQVCNDFAALDDLSSCKRSADGSKRVRVPNFVDPQVQQETTPKRRKVQRSQCSVHVQ